ncbi:OmpA family protein [Belliella marina]|uniref:OmpA family protein n=1 Tax=Belliella marina TaxID=1644146 RepID=A0ABW4VJL7_9BACT
MKKLSLSLLTMLILLACNSNGNKESNDAEETIVSSTDLSTEKQEEAEGKSITFDINSIPISDTDLGDFPFFSFPEGLEALNRPINRKFDELYFPIDGVMTPLEGKVFKTWVSVAGKHDDEWSLPYFLKSYDEAITAAGGVKIFDGKITYEEYERYHDLATYMGEDGSIGYTDENIRVYVIRRADGGDIYTQLTGNSAGGSLNILQQEGFKQTITILKSDQIQKDLEDSGKAVLHINFDLDKATLKPEGREAVAEIAKALQTGKTLKVDIHGYTDNSGSQPHNQKLSEDRAQAVLSELVDLGIDKTRLTAKGFGSQNPISDNGTEEGKAKNRRVELVKR